MSIESILAGLNDEQRQAVTSTEGAIRLIAGAGSGKTHTLTKRVAYICEKMGVAPERVLSVTFTNKAAAEMRSRVAAELKVNEDVLSICTFHSLAFEIVKDSKYKFGWKEVTIAEMSASTLTALFFSRNKGIMDDLTPDEQTRVRQCLKSEVQFALTYGYYASWLDKANNHIALAPAKEVLMEVGYKEQEAEQRAKYKKSVKDMKAGKLAKKITPAMVLEQCTEFKKMNTFLKDMKEKKGVTALESWVRGAINQKHGKCSFDDMIILAVYLLETYSDVREKWSGKFDYIQVDEFQDTDSKQLRLVKQLYASHGNLFVVGDPDQSIYLFRGAEPSLFNKLEEYIPNLKTIFMVYNYRSNTEIVDISDEVITLNKNRIQKYCVSKKGTGDRVKVLMEKSVTALVDKEFAIIKSEIEKGRAYKDIAVLFRKTNEPIKLLLLQKLKEAKIPYAVAEEQSKFITFAAALCKYNYKPKEEFLIEALNVFNKSPFTFNGLIGVYNPYRFAKVPLTVQTIKQAYIDMIMDMSLIEFGKRPETIENKKKQYLSESEMLKLEKETKAVISRWQELTDEMKDSVCYNTTELIEQPITETKDGIQFVTMHKSKGLEWPVVIVNGLTTDAMTMVGDGFDQVEEYARLAYVSYSRAKEELYIGYVTELPMQKNGQTVLVSTQMSGVLAKVLTDKLDYEGDAEVIKRVPELQKIGIEGYEQRELDTFEPYYTPLVQTVEKDGEREEKVLGYRYTMVANGEVKAFQADIDSLTRLNCIPDNKYVYIIKIAKPLEVRKVIKGHLYAFDEMFKTIKIYDCKTDDEVIAVFKGGTCEKFGLDTKDFVMLRAKLDNAVYGNWEEAETKAVKKKEDKPEIQQDKTAKKYYRVVDKNTKQDLGVKLVIGDKARNIKIPYAVYVSQNDMSGWVFEGDFEVEVKAKRRSVDKTYKEVQALNDAAGVNNKKDASKRNIYRIVDVKLGEDIALVQRVGNSTDKATRDIVDIINNVVKGSIYITNISKLCSWTGFKREE